MIRMADLAARHRRVAGACEARVLEVLRSGRYIGGPVVEEAERRLADSFGWRHGVGVNSGTDALIYALQAVGVMPGDEVIVPAVTFFASAGAVCRIGAIPVIADVRDDLPLIDPDTLPRTPRTRAVIAVHLFGERCPRPVADLPVVDDLAQTAGASLRTGDIGAVSFYPTKTLGAAGDGGLVLTDDPETARAVRLLTHHGMPRPYHHERVRGHVGANCRLDAMQAAVLLAHLDDLEARVAERRAIALRYDAALPAWVRRLPRCADHALHHYVVRVPRRDALQAHLRERGIDTAVYYPASLSTQPALAVYAPGPTPNADRFCAESLALPVHESLAPGDVDQVVDAVGSFRP